MWPDDPPVEIQFLPSSSRAKAPLHKKRLDQSDSRLPSITFFTARIVADLSDHLRISQKELQCLH